MKPRFSYTIGIVCLIAVIGVLRAVVSVDDDVKLNTEVLKGKEIRLSYILSVKNNSSANIPVAEILARGPNKSAGTQKCLGISSNQQFEILTDRDENQTLKFLFKDFPPYSTKIINIDAQMMAFAESEDKKNLSVEQKYVDEEPYIQISNYQLKEKAKSLSSADSVVTAKNIFSWVSSHLEKESQNSQPKGAVYALAKQRGDCTEFMHLFIALCRANNIPARGVSGFVLKKDTMIGPNDLHDWAQVFLKGKWQLADPFYDNFMNNEDEYIVMNVMNSALDEDYMYRWKSDQPNILIELLE